MPLDTHNQSPFNQPLSKNLLYHQPLICKIRVIYPNPTPSPSFPSSPNYSPHLPNPSRPRPPPAPPQRRLSGYTATTKTFPVNSSFIICTPRADKGNHHLVLLFTAAYASHHRHFNCRIVFVKVRYAFSRVAFD